MFNPRQCAEKLLNQSHKLLDVLIGNKSIDEVTEERYEECFKFVYGNERLRLVERIKKIRGIMQRNIAGNKKARKM